MTLKAITFDCAGTLVRVDWDLERVAVTCARELGLTIAPEAGALYKQMYYARLAEFLEVNLTRDPTQGQAFWRRLGEDWLEAVGHDRSLASKLEAVADRHAFGPGSEIFTLFEDTVDCLEACQKQGLSLAMISNWDYSLHRVLEMLNIRHFFTFVAASLEEGVEKPDPRLFELVLERLGVRPGEALHVGDHPLDDLQGAKGVGMRAVLVDRDRGVTHPPYVASLSDLPKVLGWTA